ncbi:MAG: hypothetical protein BHW57_06100 [Azospirillum sp. 47_25]|nr:MAG: hypothetical protein BHW57_06100 [Azospirillum sp. 47_25]
MPDQYLHGVEVIEIDDGARAIKTVKSSVIGLVGTAPQGPVNTPILINGSPTEAVKYFGNHVDGFTIPRALDQIFDQTGAMVVVINVADKTNSEQKSDVKQDNVKFDDYGEIVLDHKIVSDVVVKKADESVTYTETTDYTLDAFNGILTQTGESTIPEKEALMVSYKYLDTSKIKSSDVVGGANADGTYRGVNCLLAAQTEVSVQPRILIAPGFTHVQPEDDGETLANPVVSELLGIAERLKAVIIADCPDGNEQDAIKYQKCFGSARVYSVYPWVKIQDENDQIVSFPSSAAVAGLLAKSDNERGFWWSPSNTTINGIIGISKPIDFALGDTSCKANFLNENKVATIIQEDGFRLWGNRTASADEKWAFLSVRRTADMINDSLQKEHLWAVDRNITKTYVEDVCEGVNNYLRYLKNIGAIIDGKCWADASINTPDQVEQGKVTFDFDFTPPYPAEHITFRSRMVNDYLEEIFK